MHSERNKNTKGIYLLCIDGGGTKTALALADADGNIIKRLNTDRCNPMDIGIDAACEMLRRAIFEICEGVELSSVCLFAGIAGGTSGDAKAQLAALFAELGFASFENDTDAKNIIAAGLGESDGVAVIMGTGISCFARRGRELTRVGGWGYLFDGGGSGYNMGRDALAAYFCSVDGSGEKSALTDLIAEKYSDAQALLGEAYAKGKKFIASFAPLVFKAAAEGDGMAAEIIERNMRYAAHLIETAARGLDTPVRVVLAGGLTKEPTLVRCLESALDDSGKYNISVLDREPIEGALMLAKNLMKNKEE